ncbi:hypothetical protein BU25DRAFT_411764 [Macroventuria anomochaeta]|uniref:Uncharacterized protein n=1 Tax=Macroventuria anomochaeta TaxID=301207 RepID=A0ACB6RYZ1_9PLEO|nr:uncharacterized protein BU25DRAFT_411764 [Macroventuria anomochaeta]KAF2626363.1 hypothetical protein BU25DRAFT_411764 [Macroventuria anomochaeta]
MHVDAVAAWVSDLESTTRFVPSPLQSRKRRRSNPCKSQQLHKTRRVALTEMAARNHDDNPDTTKTTESKRMRTPSPSKRLFPADVYSSDADSPDELDECTPRPRQRIHPIPDLSLSYTNTLTAVATEDDLALQRRARSYAKQRSESHSRSQSQSQSQSASSARSTSPKKVTSLWDVGNGVTYMPLANTTASQREQLGRAGMALLDVLEDVADGPIFAASLRQELIEAGIEKIRQSQLDDDDDRPIEELKAELQTTLAINALSNRCAKNRDHESEWNNRVHTKVLELALGNDEAHVGFRSVATAKISSAFRPTHSPGLTTGKIVDYVIFLEPSRPARDIITSVIVSPSTSINHITYEALQTRPVAVSIETKTESRTVEEAKVQLGVWLAGQVARVEELIRQIALLETSKYGEEGTAGSHSSGREEWQGRVVPSPTHVHTQQPTPTPTTHSISPVITGLLSQIVFPLIDVQSENWSLFLGRVCTDTLISMSNPNMRKPASPIHIFHSIPLGNTANTVQTYRLIKSLKALRAWVDVELRMWWDKVLGINDSLVNATSCIHDTA